MKPFKPHKYVQPKGDKNCALYALANVFNMPIEYFDKYKVEGIGTKDTEFIINNIGYPNSYIAVMCNTIRPHLVPEDTIKFVIESTMKFTKEKDYIVMPCIIKLKNERFHIIFLLLNNERIIVSDPRHTHMLEVSIEELLSGVKFQQIAVLLTMAEFKKHYGTYITL